MLPGAEDGGGGPWSAKVPILETEPPAMDSDYEEATTCELEEKLSASEHQNSAELREDSDARRDVDDSTSDHATPAAGSTAKSKPMYDI